LLDFRNVDGIDAEWQPADPLAARHLHRPLSEYFEKGCALSRHPEIIAEQATDSIAIAKRSVNA
ncbi:MAG: hypothetical protein PUB61_09050, partial [Bacteroidales bacterium]|nr:hypothetical protein [Bacteroidales bacterium]